MSNLLQRLINNQPRARLAIKDCLWNFRHELGIRIARIDYEIWRPVSQLRHTPSVVDIVRGIRYGRILRAHTYNDIVNVGKNDILGVYFVNGTQTASANWKVGLIDNAGFTGLAAGDTSASHGGWAEWTNYSQTARVAWSPGAPAAQSVTNGTAMQFDITANGTLYGMFVINDGTKGGATGILWATAPFVPAAPVSIGDQIRSTYTLSC